MSKTPIYFKDIRPGDTVQRELLGTVLRMPVARITDALAYSPENYCVGDECDAAWYLLDRPKPPVDVPTQPTLGWATWVANGSLSGVPVLAVWQLYGPPNDSDGDLRQVDDQGKSSGGDPSTIVKFTAATAVPTEALQLLMADSDCSGPTSCAHGHIRAFLDAIDKVKA